MNIGAIFAVLIISATPTEDIGPIKENGKPVYSDFKQFRRDIELACYSTELSGAEKFESVKEKASVASTWLASQGLGQDFKAIFEAVARLDGLSKSYFFLASARDANIARCPFAEEALRDAFTEWRRQCSQGEKDACKTSKEHLGNFRAFTYSSIKDARSECKKGRPAQCALPAQYEQMVKDIEAGAPLPKAPKHLRK